MPLTRRPYAILLVVCSGWGTIGLVVRSAHMPATPIACSRIWIAAVGLGVVLWLRRDRVAGPPLFSVHRGRLVAAGMILAFHWTTFIGALQRAPIGTVVLIVFLAPVGVAAAAPRVLGERLTAATMVALAIAVVGFALVAAPGARAAGGTGFALALAAGASMIVLVLVSKPLAEVYGGLRLALGEFAVAGVVLIPVGLFATWGPARATWLWVVVLGLVHTALGVSLYLAALAKVPATHAAILGYLEPAGAVLSGWLVLDEHLGGVELAGGALIVLAGWMVVRASRPSPVDVEVIGIAG
ncbi:MAG: hypothetical protein JWO37_3613 [Acidimicrobiales bacterium]|jgi:drug/metabolite transporter (DMT)-like permease|nr:hypothetical protein [Acidimicrobiales bacterium]